MKATELNVVTNFKPIELKIVIESKTDLTYLWLITNLGVENIAKAYQNDSNNNVDNLDRLNRIRNYIDNTGKTHLWKILNEHMKNLGL